MDCLPTEKKEDAAQLLVTMLTAAPALAVELAALLDAVDAGESVFIEGVKDLALRSQLAAFLMALGLKSDAAGDDGEGARASHGFRSKKGRGWVLNTVARIMDERGLAEPPPMDREATFQAAMELVDRLAQQTSTESVREEVSILLQQILGCELVILQDLPCARIRDALTQLFDILGLESQAIGDDGEIGYGMPAQGVEDSQVILRKVIESCGISETGEKNEELGGGEDRSKSVALAPRRAPFGPAVPSPDILAQAQQAAAQLALQDYSSDDDEDAVGPHVAGKDKRAASPSLEKRSLKHQRRQELKRAAEWERVTGVDKGSQAALEKEDAKPLGREEWMLVPPKSLGVLGAIKTMQPTNRKFQISKRGAQANLHAPQAPKSKAELEAEAAAEELMAKHREARGGSLVERHRADGNKKKKKASEKEGKKAFSWSREEDLEQRRRFTPQMYEELVRKSHELDSKFSRSVARNFL